VSPLLLIVDDEREILDILQEDLNNQGYRVNAASRGEAAIETFRSMYPRPDLVLVDVVMPGMSGPMLVDKLRELDPQVQVLFMSGFHERQVVQRYVLEEGFRMILKPFTLRDLREAVKEAIDATPKRKESENIVH
jgi:two-component system cell cycle sensor histidine kinase/response regulator CckA